MAVYLVDKDNLVPGCYTDQGLATVQAVAAGDNAAEIKTVTAGDYGPLVINNSAIANTRFTNTVGNDYTITFTIGTTAALNPGPGTIFEGVNIISGGRDGIRIGDGCSLTLEDFAWQIDDAGGYHYGCRMVGKGALTLRRGRLVGSVSTLSAAVRIKPGAADACSVTLEDVGVDAGITFAYGAIHHMTGRPTISIKASGYARETVGSAMLYLDAGVTVPSATISGSYARGMVATAGAFTITSLAGGHNVYTGTVPGTSQATDVIASNKRVGGIDGDSPLHDSPLRRVIPAGTQYGGNTDRHGNPRLRGGRQCVGPVQPQDQRMPLALMVG